ncbi:MAG: hypothetical protein Q7S86_02730 [bacterium]|nr:hypothetical protein [bacterium]
MKNAQNFNKAEFKQGIAPIIIALIIALLAGGGYAVVKTNTGIAKKLGIPKQVEKKEAIADQKEEKEAKKDETAGWKTHTNKKYGFEVEYPDQWTIGEGSVKNSHPENSTSFMTMIMGYVKEPEVNVSVSTEKAQNAIAKIQKIIDSRFSYDSSVSEVAKDISKESSRYQVYNFTNPNGVKVYSYSFVGKYSETSRHFFFDTDTATIVFSVTSDVSCAKGCAFSTENEAFLAVPALRHWIDSVALSKDGQTSNWKTYTSEKYGFELLYPVEWKTYIPQVKNMVVVLGVKAGKGNGDIEGDVFVTAYKKTEIYLDKKEDGSLKSPLDTLIERIGNQFSDRKVIKEMLTINGIQATKITVTTPSLSGWKDEEFFIERGDTIFIFSNGAVPKKMFEPVVLSLKFTK